MRPTLVVMAKAPLLGSGKTRLAAEIGRVEAWRVNRRLQAKTMHAVSDPRWSTVLCVTPPRALHLRLPHVWPTTIRREVQADGDLGARLAQALQERRWVAVIGTDVLGIRRAYVASAFAALKRAPFAIGPAADGGFWLLAARSGREAAKAMDCVRWSTPHAAADVIRNIGAPVLRLATLRDVDTAADLSAWSERGDLGAKLLDA